MGKIRKDIDLNIIIEMYNNNYSILKISEKLNCSRDLVKSRLESHGINIGDNIKNKYKIIQLNKHSSLIEVNNFNFKIDNDVIDNIINLNWSVKSNGYLYNSKFGYMHRFIFEIKNKKIKNKYEIDHINNDRKDNRIENLRLVDRSKNCQNSSIQSSNKSSVSGIYFSKDRNKWVSIINIKFENKRIRRAKRFECFDDAVLKRLTWESELFKQYSNNYNHHTNTIQLTYTSHDDNKETYVEVSMDGEILTFSKK